MANPNPRIFGPVIFPSPKQGNIIEDFLYKQTKKKKKKNWVYLFPTLLLDEL